MSAPKLKILGILSEDIAELQFGNTVFQVAAAYIRRSFSIPIRRLLFLFALLFVSLQNMIVVGLTTKIYTMRVLVLDSVGPNLDTVINFIKCFPHLERLYVIVSIKHSCLLYMSKSAFDLIPTTVLLTCWQLLLYCLLSLSPVPTTLTPMDGYEQCPEV
jgi:hypothetical protein